MAEIYSYTEAIAALRQWTTALEHAASGSSYSIGGRTLTRQDIPAIRAEIQRWHNTVNAMEQARNGQARPLGSTATFPAPGRGTGGIYSQDIWERYP